MNFYISLFVMFLLSLNYLFSFCFVCLDLIVLLFFKLFFLCETYFLLIESYFLDSSIFCFTCFS